MHLDLRMEHIVMKLSWEESYNNVIKSIINNINAYMKYYFYREEY